MQAMLHTCRPHWRSISSIVPFVLSHELFGALPSGVFENGLPSRFNDSSCASNDASYFGALPKREDVRCTSSARIYRRGGHPQVPTSNDTPRNQTPKRKRRL